MLIDWIKLDHPEDDSEPSLGITIGKNHKEEYGYAELQYLGPEGAWYMFFDDDEHIVVTHYLDDEKYIIGRVQDYLENFEDGYLLRESYVSADWLWHNITIEDIWWMEKNDNEVWQRVWWGICDFLKYCDEKKSPNSEI